jgi:hypothetical protein
MHNCKLTRRNLIDLAFDEIRGAKSTQLLAEFNNCPACREEYAALRSTLHVSNQALRSALPAEGFWTGYRTRLHSKLRSSSAQQLGNGGQHSASVPPARASLSSKLWSALRTMATTSVRVPIPAALAIVLLLGVSFFVLRARGQVNVGPSTPLKTVETLTVQVPVIQEKVVTRTVYVEKKNHRSGSRANQLDRMEVPVGSNSVARTAAPGAALSLVGFTPTDEVKLTIIKGSYKDQK